MKKDIFNWLFNKDRKFTAQEVSELMEKIKEFNAGAIDHLLSKHVDQSYTAWLEEKGGK